MPLKLGHEWVNISCCFMWMLLYYFLHKRPAIRKTLQWRQNGCDSVLNHQPHDCLLNHLFRRRSKKTSKLRVTGLCVGNSPGTGEFSAWMASNAENVSIWWRHHDISTSKRYDTPNIMCLDIQIKYGLPYCVSCPSMSTDPGSLNPGTRRSRVSGWWDPGIRTNTGAGDTVLAKHT